GGVVVERLLLPYHAVVARVEVRQLAVGADQPRAAVGLATDEVAVLHPGRPVEVHALVPVAEVVDHGPGERVTLLRAGVVGQAVVDPARRRPDQAAVRLGHRVAVEHLDVQPGGRSLFGDRLPLHLVTVEAGPVVLGVVQAAVGRGEAVVAGLPVYEQVRPLRRADLGYDHADRCSPVRALAVLL